jgi:hypothetical protein
MCNHTTRNTQSHPAVLKITSGRPMDQEGRDATHRPSHPRLRWPGSRRPPSSLLRRTSLKSTHFLPESADLFPCLPAFSPNCCAESLHPCTTFPHSAGLDLSIDRVTASHEASAQCTALSPTTAGSSARQALGEMTGRDCMSGVRRSFLSQAT